MNEERDYCIYEHIFPNGMVYIGLTKQKPQSRWRYGEGYKKQKKIYSAICEFGWENIKHVIVKDNLTMEEAKELEKELIKKYKKEEITYNEDDGGGIGGAPRVKIAYNGKIYTSQELSELSSVEGLTYHDITTRINHHGWSVEKALTKKKAKKNTMIEYNGEMYLIKDLLQFSKVDGLTYGILRDRLLNHNWNIEIALSQPINVKLQPKGIGERIYEYDGKMYNSYELFQVSNVKGITPFDITNRINHHGWSVYDAITKPKKEMNKMFKYKGKLYTSKELEEIAHRNGLENIASNDITDRIRNGWSV